MFPGWSPSFLTSLSLWWDLGPSGRKCPLRPPQHFCAALLLPAWRHVPFGKPRIEPPGGLWREWVSSMGSAEFPAPLLKAVAGKGWNSRLGPSLGPAEGSCSTASPWDSPGTWALTEGPARRPASLGSVWPHLQLELWVRVQIMAGGGEGYFLPSEVAPDITVSLLGEIECCQDFLKGQMPGWFLGWMGGEQEEDKGDNWAT